MDATIEPKTQQQSPSRPTSPKRRNHGHDNPKRRNPRHNTTSEFIIANTPTKTNECINTPTDIVRLWAHETQRVYLDKLADAKDIDVFEKMQKDYMKKSFDDIPESEAMRKPLIYCHFAKYVIYINK